MRVYAYCLINEDPLSVFDHVSFIIIVRSLDVNDLVCSFVGGKIISVKVCDFLVTVVAVSDS